jgi:hypothetical protein
LNFRDNKVSLLLPNKWYSKPRIIFESVNGFCHNSKMQICPYRLNHEMTCHDYFPLMKGKCESVIGGVIRNRFKTEGRQYMKCIITTKGRE